jgi:outer membrane protein assembly factor BamB
VRRVVTVLDALTGERRWETTLDRPPALLVTNAVVALDTPDERTDAAAEVDAGVNRARLTALDIGSGATVWTVVPAPGAVVVGVPTNRALLIGMG